MPYNSDQISLKFTHYLTREYHELDSVWYIDEILNRKSQNDPNENPSHQLFMRFSRRARTLLYTVPSYIVYILTLLMFWLPQTSNQRVLIGSASLIISTLLIYMMSVNMSHSDLSAWPILGKLYLFNIVLLTFAILFSSFIINVAQPNHTKSVPDWLRKVSVVLSIYFK